LFRKECPRLSKEAKGVISKMGHWYLDERETYIRVFRATGAPHLLPIYVPDRLVLGEICYQTILQGYNATLVKEKKRAFILYGFHIGFYMVKDTTHAKQEGLSQLEFWFQTGRFHKHDPKGLVSQHASQVSSYWPYAHDQFKDEIFTENAQDWDEVASRRVDPRMTRFKAMSLEEQATSLEQTTQEILRAQEGTVASEPSEGIGDPQEGIEAATVYQESPVQIRDLPEDQAAQEMGALLYQQGQLLMKRMQDDPYLIIRPAISTTIRSTPTESSGPGPMNPDNTNGLGNPESSTSSVHSSEGGTTQTETGRVSIETQAPNPLRKLIHIYSDDESPESSHDTPVHVQEEGGPEKTSSPEPEFQDQEVSQKEIETESGLDTKGPNESEVEADPNDGPEPEETKKGSPQKEINSSVADEQVSNEPIPDTSILPNAQIPDERQVGVGPARYSKEVRESNLEQIYTTGSLGNKLTWGDQQIPEPVDEVADIYAISYDQKRKAIVQRTAKKRRISLDHSILVTTEENLINTADTRTSELIGIGKSLSDATLDRARRDEKELATTLKELEHLRHLVEYYKGATQTIVYLKGEFVGVYNEFKKERHLLLENIAEFQEDTLMALTTCKEMERWYERAQQV
jgi:hypothetical protein